MSTPTDNWQDQPTASLVLETIQGLVGTYRGAGRNHLNEAFEATLVLEPGGGLAGILLMFTAKAAAGQSSPAGTVFHTEHSLIAATPDGRLVLAQVGSNMGALLMHELRHATIDDGGCELLFGYGVASSGEFAEELTLRLRHSGSASYAFAWGYADEPFGPRSAAELRLVTPEQAPNEGG